MTFVSALQQHARTLNPALPLITPGDSQFEDTRACFVKRDGSKPAAIARPKNVAHVQALVRYCTANKIDFVVRTGGHDCAGRSQVNGALTIDMRDLNSVRVGADEKTATVGGGVLVRDLAKALDARGLVTPVGSMGTVGYVGWAILGGYGIFSPRYGLGVDQIVGAKLVNARGDVIEADDDLLRGIRGGGGIFGVIVEMTMKVYPLKQLLTSFLIFESSNMKAAWTNFVTGYQQLDAKESLPTALQVHPYGMELPGLGKAFTVVVTWTDDDHEEGKKWFGKIAALGTCIVNNPEAKTVSAYAAFNETLVTYGSYGRVYTMNIARYTTKTAEVLAKYNELLPGGGMTISVHNYRASAPGRASSVFGVRQPHHMCEIICTTPTAELEAKGREWARDMIAEIKRVDPDNVLESSYVALVDEADDAVDYRKIYGSQYDTLVGLKKKYDPGNVFKNTVPRL